MCLTCLPAQAVWRGYILRRALGVFFSGATKMQNAFRYVLPLLFQLKSPHLSLYPLPLYVCLYPLPLYVCLPDATSTTSGSNKQRRQHHVFRLEYVLQQRMHNDCYASFARLSPLSSVLLLALLRCCFCRVQWRAYTARECYKKKRTALIMLQSMFRMRLERVRFLKYRAARLVQVRNHVGANNSIRQLAY